ncbi:MAG: polynucleotide kinase-phosphatase [Chloroflexota bacterium]|nr:polynucleotide kinase-phosphatase [Chloroflexota bacterium]
MKITIPELALVVLVGASGSGKSTFARAHFKPTEVLSSDYFRGLVADDENDQAAGAAAFDVLHYVAGKRLAAGRLTVVDATNVQAEARKPLLALARAHSCLPVAIVLNLPAALCHERNRARPDREFGPHVVHNHTQQLRRSLGSLRREGFRHIFVLDSPDAVAAATVERQPLWNNRKGEHGPFDIIGDIHGCADELHALLTQLGYTVTPTPDDAAGFGVTVTPPPGRKAVFLGDLVDRGPATPAVLRLVMSMVAAGTALAVPGNHDIKLMRKLRGRPVTVAHGLAESLAQLEAEPPAFRDQVAPFLDGLVSHYVLDDGKLVVAHAGMKEELQGRAAAAVRDFALYGETTGETDEFGLPVRYNWAAEYHGPATVVYGHTPVPQPDWLNRTLNIDTGCVFGGRLTALRYPEMELVAVPALRAYAAPARPPADLSPTPSPTKGGELDDDLSPSTSPTKGGELDGERDSPFLRREGGGGVRSAPALTAQQQHDELLDISDVLHKRIISTALRGNITIRAENAAAALEVMSRFAADPRWLIYLPPTMSPSETTAQPGLLEHPAEAFAYYRANGADRVVCEEKHMGSRAPLIVCRDAEAARRRFGVTDGTSGICYTRTGRRFFDDPALEAALLDRVRAALTAAGFWEEWATDWVLLDCELLPWSAKAQELLRRQYAAVGAAARAALGAAVPLLELAAARTGDPGLPLAHFIERAQGAGAFVDAYRHYCWPVAGLADLRLAPFHILATEGAVHSDRDHTWHMDTLAAVCRADLGDSPLLVATPYQVVDLADPAAEAAGTAWWEALTARGGEGMVVKPWTFVASGPRGLLQPAIKCRGREYLRIIYGPDYTAPANLDRLRRRGVGGKRSLALREFALGLEGLTRFVRRDPLRHVHECVFGVLALESEPVDPRL